MVRDLLRDGRRDAALPRPALGGLALDGRRRAGASGCKGSALAALEWIDRYGDRDGDGFVEYERRTERGLENQSWKDSGDSQRFPDGTFAWTPIAPVEVQGYVYDAKVRLAELAREVWRDAPLAQRLEREAAELRTRFDDAYWVEERGCYALALDGDKRPVDSLCSNIGHLLWSGIVPPERVEAIADASWARRSGRGGASARCRPATPRTTRSATTTAPSGRTTRRSARGGSRARAAGTDARRITETLLDAARWFEWSLPEVFAGYGRDETPFPIAYPTAARPQAWAAGHAGAPAPPPARARAGRRRRATLVTVCAEPLPEWVGSSR